MEGIVILVAPGTPPLLAAWADVKELGATTLEYAGKLYQRRTVQPDVTGEFPAYDLCGSAEPSAKDA